MLVRYGSLLYAVLDDDVISVVRDLSRARDRDYALNSTAANYEDCVSVICRLIRFFLSVLLRLLLNVAECRDFLYDDVTFSRERAAVIPIRRRMTMDASPTDLDLSVLLNYF